MIRAALNFIPGWAWAAIVAGLVATNCTTTIQRDTARRSLAELRTQHAQAEQLRAETARAAEADARERERTHADTLQAITTEAAHEKHRLASDLKRALDSLRHRPERPAGPAGGAVPAGAGDPVGCTGAELFRGDAAFLVREASRADELRADLVACQAAYDSAVTLTAAPD